MVLQFKPVTLSLVYLKHPLLISCSLCATISLCGPLTSEVSRKGEELKLLQKQCYTELSGNYPVFCVLTLDCIKGKVRGVHYSSSILKPFPSRRLSSKLSPPTTAKKKGSTLDSKETMATSLLLSFLTFCLLLRASTSQEGKSKESYAIYNMIIILLVSSQYCNIAVHHVKGL